MSSHKKTGISVQKKVTKEVLEQYLFGTLTEAQRHQVERQLLDDSLTAEATEGLSTQKDAAQMTANLADLRGRLQNRIARQEEKRQIHLPFGMQPYAIAASIAVLLVSAVVVLFSIHYLQKKEKADTIAVSQTTPAPVAATPVVPPLANAAPAVEAHADTKESVMLEKQVAVPEVPVVTQRARPHVSIQDSHTGSSPSWSNKDTRVASSTPAPASGFTAIQADSATIASVTTGSTTDIEVLSEKVAAVEETAKANQAFKTKRNSVPEKQMMAAVEKKTTHGVQMVEGKVTDVEDGLGIPGVVVSVPGTSVTAVTDRSGVYKIAVPAEQNELSFSFIGYQTYYSPVNQQPVLNARLVPDVKTMGEVVVVTQADKTGNATAAYQPAQPVNPDFIKTIEQKLEASPTVFSGNGPATIKLSFTVQPDGSLTDVKVLKGVCSECDQIAVQALKESSAWKPAKENGKPVSQTMRIRIPLKGKKKK